MFEIIVTNTGTGAVVNRAEADDIEGAALAAKTLWVESLPFVDDPAIVPRRACVPMRVTITLDGRPAYTGRVGEEPK